MKETLDQKKERIAKSSFDLSADGVQSLFTKLHSHAKHSADKLLADLPGLELPADLKDFKPE